MFNMIYKTGLILIMAISITAVGSSITAAQQSANNVNQYFYDITTLIAESHYSENIIEQCILDAEENGYTLRIELFEGYAMAELDYLYEIRLLGVSEQKTKCMIL